jgi:hypothetical protein
LGNSRSDGSYFFSRYVSFWGWASWRRTWNYYDIGMKTWPDFKRSGQLEMICDDECEFAYWNNIFDRTFSGEIKTWDYQMVYACWSQGCLNIQPNKNLISNIGFAHPDATNLRRKTSYADLPVLDIRELRHPPFVVRHRDADLFAFNEKYFGKQMRAQNSFPKKIYARLSKMKRKVLSIFNTLITKA